MKPAEERGSASSVAGLGATTFFLITVATAAWLYATSGPGVDFASFWAAGRMVLAGQPALAYDVEAHRALEMTVAHMKGLMPFPYPPPFLFVVALFAFRPFWLAYLAWMAASGALYFIAARRLVAARYVFAQPAAIVNAIIGQNGFLTSGIFISGLRLLESNPLAGGAVLGLLVIKPQLALLLPVALLASGNWRAIAGGIVSGLILLALSAVVFGSASYAGFAGMGQNYGSFMAADRWNWAETASVFGFLRYFGTPQPIALALQGVSAIAAAIFTWRAWSEGAKDRAEILASATLLVPPYLFTYDSLLLILPLALLLRDKAHSWRLPIAWLLLLVPLGGYVGIYTGPNTVPLVAGLCLYWLSRKQASDA